jgi:hypothetical protein
MLLSVVHKNNSLGSGQAVFAGSLAGTLGDVDDTGSNARFSSPSYIVSDENGNFYVSDRLNHKIRKINKFGVVTTVFGTGSSGSTLTTLNSPRGLALDVSNNLYVSDFSNNRILRVPNGLTLGNDATLIASSVYDVDEIAVNSDGTKMVFKTTATAGQNLIQYRNGVVEGLINTSQNSSVPNVASITCNPDGQFYYSTNEGQAINYQISAYKMYLNPPTTYTITVTGISQSGTGPTNPVTISLDGYTDPVALGLTVGQTFILSGFSTDSINGYIGTISALNSSGYNIRFKYSGNLDNYPVGVPNTGACITNGNYAGGAKYRVLAVGWDTIPVEGGGGANTDAPGSVLRMNFYLGSSTYDFPAISFNSTSPQTVDGASAFENFQGIFSIYTGQNVEGTILDYTFDDNAFIITGTTDLSFIHTFTIAEGVSVPNDFTPVGGYVVGPTIEPGTIITAYNRDAREITTNKAFSIAPNSVSFKITTTGDTAIHNYTNLLETALILPGMRILGDGAGSATIIEVIQDLTDRTKGTIISDLSFNANTDPQYEGYTGAGKYFYAPWPGASRRVFTTTFTQTGFPTGTGGTLTTTIINNNPTPLLIDGVYYGTFLKNMQFSKRDSNLLYAYLQKYDGIREYSIIGDTLIKTDENVEIPNVNPFAVFPNTSEITALTTQASSNNILIYESVY